MESKEPRAAQNPKREQPLNVLLIDTYDLLGRRVLALPAQTVAAGSRRTVDVDTSSLASGVYFYRVRAQSDTQTMIETGRMVLRK